MGDILINLRAALTMRSTGHATSLKTLNSNQRGDRYHPMLTVRAEWDGTPETTAQDGTVTEAKLGVRDKLQALVAPDVLQVIERLHPASLGRPTSSTARLRLPTVLTVGTRRTGPVTRTESETL